MDPPPPAYGQSGQYPATASQYPAAQYPPAQYPAVTGDRNYSGWYPGYDAQVEEKTCNMWINRILRILLFLSIPAVIVCGIFLIHPAVVSLDFTPGSCSLKTLTYKDLKGCSCGKNCKSNFPCFELDGSFVSTTTTSATIYSSYWSYSKKCTFDKCGRDMGSNWVSIYKEFDLFFTKNGYESIDIDAAMKTGDYVAGQKVADLDTSKLFDCFGDGEGVVYLQETATAAFFGGGFVPVAVLFFTIIGILKCATPGERFWMQHMFGFPYYLITDHKNACKYACPSKRC